MDKNNMVGIDLDRIYETYIQIPDKCMWSIYIDILRNDVAPMLSDLKGKGVIGWFCFLVHKAPGKAPKEYQFHPSGHRIYYVHIRLEVVNKEITLDELGDLLLPSVPFNYEGFQGKARKIKRARLETIKGVDTSLLEDGQIEAGWQMVGECSKWILKMLSAHGSEKNITQLQVLQFMHYITNGLYFCDRLIESSKQNIKYEVKIFAPE